MLKFPIVDLHNDLLSYLTDDPARSPDDSKSNASYPQLCTGGVILQTMALFCPTKQDSTESGLKQAVLFSELSKRYPLYFTKEPAAQEKIQVIASIENGSIFAEEDEPLETSFHRLVSFEKALGRILYMSLTWNTENRFGGGNESQTGLKPDGEHLLRHLAKKKIAVDFSHTSDRLAEDILSYNDQYDLQLRFLASHSNFRDVTDQPRNQPKWLAEEIIRRKGIIGLNFFSPFIGKNPHDLIRHVAYGLELGGEDALSFGADFFLAGDLPYFKTKYGDVPSFFPEYPNASSYPTVLHHLREALKIPEHVLKKISSQNALRFIQVPSEAR